MTDFILLASKITTDGNCSHEIKRRLFLERKAVTNLDSIFKRRGITLPTKVHPQFIVIHTVKGFGIVSKAERDVFLELSCFFHDPADVGNLISGSSAPSKTSLNIREFTDGGAW